MVLLIVGCSQEIQKQNCQSYNGYLCSGPDDCALPYLGTIESYCCPMKCQTCNKTCDDNNLSTKDLCSESTKFKCIHKAIPTCDSLHGHLCKTESECDMSTLDTIDKYCCPIECGVLANTYGVVFTGGLYLND